MRILPSIKELQEQYATLNAEKKILQEKYHDIKAPDKEIESVWVNIKSILSVRDDIQIESPKRHKC